MAEKAFTKAELQKVLDDIKTANVDRERTTGGVIARLAEAAQRHGLMGRTADGKLQHAERIEQIGKALEDERTARSRLVLVCHFSKAEIEAACTDVANMKHVHNVPETTRAMLTAWKNGDDKAKPFTQKARDAAMKARRDAAKKAAEDRAARKTAREGMTTHERKAADVRAIADKVRALGQEGTYTCYADEANAAADAINALATRIAAFKPAPKAKPAKADTAAKAADAGSEASADVSALMAQIAANQDATQRLLQALVKNA